jgi:hypothetical protein
MPGAAGGGLVSCIRLLNSAASKRASKKVENPVLVLGRVEAMKVDVGCPREDPKHLRIGCRLEHPLRLRQRGMTVCVPSYQQQRCADVPDALNRSDGVGIDANPRVHLHEEERRKDGGKRSEADSDSISYRVAKGWIDSLKDERLDGERIGTDECGGAPLRNAQVTDPLGGELRVEKRNCCAAIERLQVAEGDLLPRAFAVRLRVE